jgi:hypothetical protein
MRHPFDGIEPERRADESQRVETRTMHRRSVLARWCAAIGGILGLGAAASACERGLVPREVTTMMLGEEGGESITSALIPSESGGPSTAALREEGGQPTTLRHGEEGGRPQPTTLREGEEGGGPRPTTRAVGEEGSGPTTTAVREEGASTEALHEEAGATTTAMWETGRGTRAR